jgi:hypothetical protein
LAKGIASKNSLKALAHPLQRYLSGWGAQERVVPADGTGTELPAPYALASLRGEGVLRERFFGAFVAKLPVQLDADQQIALWHELVEEGGLITEWVQRLGLVKALRREAVVAVDIGKESRALYTLLLDVLRVQSPELLPWAVEAYFWHCWKARFPSAASETGQEKKTTDAAVLRDRLTRALRRRYSEAVEVKESFIQGDDKVSFALLAKRKSVGKWEQLVSVERPRLKTARLAGYDAASKAMTIPLHAEITGMS